MAAPLRNEVNKHALHTYIYIYIHGHIHTYVYVYEFFVKYAYMYEGLFSLKTIKVLSLEDPGDDLPRL